MDASTPNPQRPREYHVLVEGQMHGPFTMESLKAAVQSGDVTVEDLVQVGGLPIWRPLRQFLESPEAHNSNSVSSAPSGPPPLPISALSEGGAGGTTETAEVADAGEGEGIEALPLEEVEDGAVPGWKLIAQTAWARLRADFEERSVGTGLICLGAGVVACLLSFWPFLFWLPWFGLAFFAGFDALKRGKTMQGVSLLLASCALPIVLSTVVLPFFRPRPAEPVDLLLNETSRPRGATNTSGRGAATASSADKATRPSQPSVPFVIESVKPDRPVQPLEPPAKVPPGTPPGRVSTPVPAPRTNVVPTPATQPAAKAPEPSAPVAAPAQVPAAKAAESTLLPFGLGDLLLEKENPIRGGDLVQRHRDAFIVVKDGSASGSGFICRDGQKAWLFTNIHVAAGMRNPQFSRLDGAQIRVGAAEAGGARDVVRIAIGDSAQALEILPHLDASAKIGDDVVVLGNSGGGGVVTTLSGKLVGIGPDRIEVTAEFIPGNSGSPIVHVPTGKVIGIATYLTKRYEEFAGASTGKRTGEGLTVRRFGYRLDQIPRWEPVNWTLLHSEAEQLRKISALTADVFDFLDALREEADPQFSTDTLRRPATEWLSGIRRQNVSEVDRNRVMQNFLSSLRFMVRADVTAAENQLRYSYFRERLAKEREVRDRLYKAFDDDVKRMASPSLR